AEVGAQARLPYQGFPTTEAALTHYLTQLGWTQPWAAGAHVATVAVFLQVEAPRFLPPERIAPLLDICRRFTADLVDTATGAYFKGTMPPYGELVNGAMKI